MRIHRIVTTAIAGAALAAGLAFAPSPALAGHKHHRGCGHYPTGHHYYYDDESHDHRSDDEYYDGYYRRGYRHHRTFVVPDQIVYADVGDYRAYYQRSVYHAPHRHNHAVYAFPVYGPHGVAYRHVPYCRRSQGYVAFAGPRFAVQVGF